MRRMSIFYLRSFSILTVSNILEKIRRMSLLKTRNKTGYSSHDKSFYKDSLRYCDIAI